MTSMTSMTTDVLQQAYKEQLIKAGVEPMRAMRVAATMTGEELSLISEIWSDWGDVLRNSELSQWDSKKVSSSPS